MESLRYGKVRFEHDQSPPAKLPLPILSMKPILIAGRKIRPQLGDRHIWRLLQRKERGKPLAFRQAYARWFLSGSPGGKRWQEGDAFLKWAVASGIKIVLQLDDLDIDPRLLAASSEEDANFFFLLPVVDTPKGKVRLYLRDEDMWQLLNKTEGREIDFLECVTSYIHFRQTSTLKTAASFLAWVIQLNLRPVIRYGQLLINQRKLTTCTIRKIA